jgi:hypothetical protein
MASETVSNISYRPLSLNLDHTEFSVLMRTITAAESNQDNEPSDTTRSGDGTSSIAAGTTAQRLRSHQLAWRQYHSR